MITLPSYKEGNYGEWKLRQAKGYDFGYWSEWGREDDTLYSLSKQSTTWMSTSRMERESHEFHLADRTGTVVVAGIGLGMYLNSVAKIDAVTNVHAVEIDPEIISLLTAATDISEWEHCSKIQIHNFDAMAIPRDVIPPQVDYLYVDIWPVLGDKRAIKNTRHIQDRVRAKYVRYWGQETDFALWLIGREKELEQDRNCLRTVCEEDWNTWASLIGLPMKPPSTEWLRQYLPMIVLNMVLRISRDNR
jgi:hypothetical protein